MQPQPLTVLANPPLVRGASINPWEYIVSDDYRDVISALGGFWSAAFPIATSRMGIDRWLSEGLSRHIEVYDYAQEQVWEGFVNKVTVDLGGVSLQSGPFLNVANDVRVVYSTIFVDPVSGETVLGTRDTTTVVEDAESQTRWGVMPRVLSIAGAEPTEAAQIGDTYLGENAWPQLSEPMRLSQQQAGKYTVRVECLGYWHLLNYPYYSTTTGVQTYTAKILAIFAYCPNAWIGFDTSGVDTNTLTIKAYEQKDRIAKNLLKDMASRGGAANERWTMGVYKNRRVMYSAAPTDMEYLFRVGDRKLRVMSAVGEAELRPSSVLPGRWVMFPDVLAGSTQRANPHASPISMFIDERRYDGKGSVELTGANTGTLQQLLAKLGLAGIGT